MDSISPLFQPPSQIKVICISCISKSVFQGTLVPRGFLQTNKQKGSFGYQLWATLSWKFTKIRQPIKGFEKTYRKVNMYDFVYPNIS